MEIVSSNAELLKALTDLPIALICIPFAFLSREKVWRAMFACLALAAFLGCFAHAVVMDDMALRITWVVLYGLMTAAVYYFYMAFMYSAHKEVSDRQKKTVLLFSVIMYIGCAVIRLVTGMNMILLFAVYALVIALQAVVCILKADKSIKAVKLLRISLLILICGLACQGMVAVFPMFNGAMAAHIFIIIALFFIFKASRSNGETL